MRNVKPLVHRVPYEEAVSDYFVRNINSGGWLEKEPVPNSILWDYEINVSDTVIEYE